MAKIIEWEKEIEKLSFNEALRYRRCIRTLLDEWSFFHDQFNPLGLGTIQAMLTLRIGKCK